MISSSTDSSHSRSCGAYRLHVHMHCYTDQSKKRGPACATKDASLLWLLPLADLSNRHFIAQAGRQAGRQAGSQAGRQAGRGQSGKNHLQGVQDGMMTACWSPQRAPSDFVDSAHKRAEPRGVHVHGCTVPAHNHRQAMPGRVQVRIRSLQVPHLLRTHLEGDAIPASFSHS